jgi:hypothetical protein
LLIARPAAGRDIMVRARPQVSRDLLGGRRMKFSLGLALAAGLACTISSTQNRGVKIPGVSTEVRLALAQKLVQSVLESDPAEALRESVPGASDELLSKLRLNPKRMAGVTTGDGVFDEVWVQCSVTASPSDEVATRLVEACQALLEEHLTRLASQDSAAQQANEAARPPPVGSQ